MHLCLRPNHIVVLIALALGASACSAEGAEDDLRDAVPTVSELAMNVPGGDASPEGAASYALVGQQAELYQMTRRTSSGINQSLAEALAGIENITDHPAAEVHDDYAVWGPHNNALSPLTYLFIVQRVEEGHFRYVLRAKPRSSADEAYVDLVIGESEVNEAAGIRRGSIAFDMSAGHGLDPNEHPNVGRAAARYDASSSPRLVEAAFEQIDREAGDEEILADALYRYTEAQDGAGTFEFAMRSDLEDEGSLAEDIFIASQWNATGAGRGDAVAAGGDLSEAVAYASECWDHNFGRTFYANNYSGAAPEGDATTCVFTESLDSNR